MNSSSPSPSDAMTHDPDPIERMEEAAVRLGMNIHTLRSRVRRLAIQGAPAGRPKAGTSKGLPRSEWDKCRDAWPHSGRLPRQYDNPSPRAPWDVAEDRILCRMAIRANARTGDVDWPHILRLLPRRNRTVAGVRLSALRVVGLRPMGPRDHDRMVNHYAMAAREEDRSQLPRGGRFSPDYLDRYASFYKIGPPAGRLTLPAMADRMGFTRRSLVALLKRQGVEVIAARRLSDGCLLYSHIDEAECIAAVDRDMAQETVAQAARRHGLSDHGLRAWMIEAGYEPPGRPGKVTKHTPEAFDAVVAAKHKAAAETVRLRTASRDTGIARSTLRDWLRSDGVDTRRPVPAAIVTAVVNTRRPQSVECA